MKKASLMCAVVSSILCSSVFAAPQNEKSATKSHETRQVVSDVSVIATKKAGYIKSGTTMTPYMSVADRISFNVPSQQGTLNTDNAFGVGVQKQEIAVNGVGYSFGVFFEAPRDISSITSNAVRTLLDKGEEERFAFLYFEPSMTYGINDNLYAFAGLSYGIPTMKQMDIYDVSGTWGMQAGFGYKVNEKWSFEGSYREMNFFMTANESVDPSNTASGFVDLGKASMNGLMLKVAYSVN